MTSFTNDPLIPMNNHFRSKLLSHSMVTAWTKLERKILSSPAFTKTTEVQKVKPFQGKKFQSQK